MAVLFLALHVGRGQWRPMEIFKGFFRLLSAAYFSALCLDIAGRVNEVQGVRHSVVRGLYLTSDFILITFQCGANASVFCLLLQRSAGHLAMVRSMTHGVLHAIGWLLCVFFVSDLQDRTGTSKAYFMLVLVVGLVAKWCTWVVLGEATPVA